MIRLLFPLTDTLTIAEHAIAAPGHHQSYAQMADDVTATPALHWVKDDGTYLMSNGNPGLPADPANPHGGQQVVAALGYGPDTRQDLGHTDIGGDDFVEHIDLTDPAGETQLIDALRQAATRGWEWFAIDVDGDTIAIRIFATLATADKR